MRELIRGEIRFANGELAVVESIPAEGFDSTPRQRTIITASDDFRVFDIATDPDGNSVVVTVVSSSTVTTPADAR